jgi:hypothetical protein
MRMQVKLRDIKTANSLFENVEFKYLGATVTHQHAASSSDALLPPSKGARLF